LATGFGGAFSGAGFFVGLTDPTKVLDLTAVFTGAFMVAAAIWTETLGGACDASRAHLARVAKGRSGMRARTEVRPANAVEQTDASASIDANAMVTRATRRARH